MEIKNDYRLNKIVFKNYKGYENEQVFDFTTTNRYQKDRTTQNKVWNSNSTLKYKKIIGIWGKNSSGKSSFFQIINLWKTLFVKKNIKYFENQHLLINSEEYFDILKMKYEHQFESIFEPNEFNDFSYFNDKEKPIEITFFFSDSDFSFEYKLELKTKNEKNNSINITEFFTIKKNNIQILYFEIIEENSLYELIQLHKILIDTKEKTKLNSYDLLSIIETKFDVTNIEFVMNKYNFEIIEKIWNILIDFHSGTNFLEQDSMLIKNFKFPFLLNNNSGIKSINTNLKNIYASGKINKNQIKEFLLLLITNVDPNIQDIEIYFGDKQKNKNEVIFKSIINRNGIKNFPDELSLGTISYLELMLQILCFTKFSSSTKIRYIFVDELGLNWHTNLTKEFLFRISNGMLGEETILVFSSHDPYIGDCLNNDSIYVINNEQNLIKISDLKNRNGNLPRKNSKFSSNYLDEIMDIYSVTPSLFKFDDIEDFINDIE